MRQSRLTTLGTELEVPSVGDAEAVELERTWVADVARHATRKLEAVGMRRISIQGSSGQGWIIAAELGDGRPVATDVTVDDINNLPDSEDRYGAAMELFVVRLLEEAERETRPPESPGDGPLVGSDAVGVQFGEQILDKIGQSGIDRLGGILRGEETASISDDQLRRIRSREDS